MRIKSLTLRNYRMHRERHLDFDPARTLIGGPNEIGKSTVVEALHRALFLKAKGNTEHHRAMQSALHPGHPEVEAVFEAGGVEHHVHKRFGGNGNTTLSSTGEAAISGEAAEDRLALMLQVESGVSGRAVLAQWAHLWVWQGQAGDDPTSHATDQQASLLKRLQSDGAAAALQSDLDARVTGEFASRTNEIFTKNGAARANSKLERAQKAAHAAAAALNAARIRAEQLESAVATLEAANREIPAIEENLSELRLEHKAVVARIAEITQLRHAEAEQARASSDAEDRLKECTCVDQKIRATREEVERLQAELKPRRDRADQTARALETARVSAAEKEKEYRTAGETLRRGRLQSDLAAAYRRRFEALEQQERLNRREEKVTALREALSLGRNELARLPAVTEAGLAGLRECESRRNAASSRLQAMAAGLELLDGEQTVLIDGHKVEPGKRLILTEDTVISIGEKTQLRITPGGGTTLSEARQEEADSVAALQQALDALSLDSVPAATIALSKRETVTRKISDAEERLNELDADDLDEEISRNAEELNEVASLVERLTSQADESSPPTGRTEAQDREGELRQEVSDFEASEQSAKQLRDEAFNHRESLEAELDDCRTGIEAELRRIDELKGQIALLTETHGDDAQRAQAIFTGRTDRDQAQTILTNTRGALAKLQPDLIDADRDRIDRSIHQKTGELSDIRVAIASARQTLRLDGTEDPQSELASAEAEAVSARDHLASVTRQSDATALLDRLFREEQRSLAERFTQPLAEKISGYLQCVFGPTAKAKVSLEDNQFNGLSLHRSDTSSAAFEFDRLSGGTREQVAAAVRLAMAEVLAEDHDGCLPAVFDDAFAFSDPERVRQLQRMLDLAARRGLQIVVLTCNPADYAGLGARQIILQREAVTAVSGEPAGQSPPQSPATDSRDDEARQTAFLQRLRELEGKSGNGALRESLGWDEATYNLIKDNLLENGTIVSGRGRGGSVALVE